MNVSPSSGNPRALSTPVSPGQETDGVDGTTRHAPEHAPEPRERFLALFPGDSQLAERLLERVAAPSLHLERLTPPESDALVRPEVCAGLQACAEEAMPDGLQEATLDAARLGDGETTRRILGNFPTLAGVSLVSWPPGPDIHLTGLGEHITSIALLGPYPAADLRFHVREGVRIAADQAPTQPSALAQAVSVDDSGAERTVSLGHRKAGRAPTVFRFLDDDSARLRQARAIAALICMPLEMRLDGSTLDLSRSPPGELDRITIDAWLVFRAEHPEMSRLKLPPGYEFGFRLGDDVTVTRERPAPRSID